ncbi:MAG: hypothetical protein KatS3mg004_0455 [Bryobacteraceae bacterium]|nr:MAG: hypothetical protein KatS3mg004_0455 [Bryobacteraceae bacterium]
MYPEAVPWLLVMLAAFTAHAGGLDPRPRAADYPLQAALEAGTLAAEYHGRAFESQAGRFFTQDFLVVEVALFPSDKPAEFAPSHFRLRLNGRPPELLPVTPGTVALALRNPDQYEQRQQVVAGGGVGGGQVIFGRPRPVERFPGDPEARIPTPGGSRQASPGEEAAAAAETAERFGLARVEAPRGGAAGLIYFHWRGKHAKLKRIELLYDGPAGRAVLRLR